MRSWAPWWLAAAPLADIVDSKRHKWAAGWVAVRWVAVAGPNSTGNWGSGSWGSWRFSAGDGKGRQGPEQPVNKIQHRSTGDYTGIELYC